MRGGLNSAAFDVSRLGAMCATDICGLFHVLRLVWWLKNMDSWLGKRQQGREGKERLRHLLVELMHLRLICLFVIQK